jgi:hypothetical protein
VSGWLLNQGLMPAGPAASEPQIAHAESLHKVGCGCFLLQQQRTSTLPLTSKWYYAGWPNMASEWSYKTHTVIFFFN